VVLIDSKCDVDKEQPTFEGLKVLKAGTLNGNELDGAKWEAELYAPGRNKFVQEQAGAGQVNGMPL
jgi:hypothetical protein